MLTRLLLFVPLCSVEDRGGHEGCRLSVRAGLGLSPTDRIVADLGAIRIGPSPASAVAEVRFEHLTHIHPGRDAQRIQNDVHGLTIGVVRHVLNRKDLGDNALVAVPTSELVAHRDLAFLSHINTHELVDTRGQLIAVVAIKHLDVNDLADLAVRHLEASVPDFASLLTENCPQEALFRG